MLKKQWFSDMRSAAMVKRAQAGKADVNSKELHGISAVVHGSKKIHNKKLLRQADS